MNHFHVKGNKGSQSAHYCPLTTLGKSGQLKTTLGKSGQPETTLDKSGQPETTLGRSG